MDILKASNLSLRFLLELVALGALGYWGYRTETGATMKGALMIGAPLAAAVLWAMFASPKASVNAPQAIRVLVQVLVFGTAVLALWRMDRETAAAAFGGIAIVNAALLAAWNQ